MLFITPFTLILSAVLVRALPSAEPAPLSPRPDLSLRESTPAYELLVGGEPGFLYDFSKLGAEACDFDESAMSELAVAEEIPESDLEFSPATNDGLTERSLDRRAVPLTSMAVVVFVNPGCNTAAGYRAFPQVARGRLTCTNEYRSIYVNPQLRVPVTVRRPSLAPSTTGSFCGQQLVATIYQGNCYNVALKPFWPNAFGVL
ncbi:hypothetical protein B0H34DRAFT_14324 [Crassisporium funariophilum]|nr:hypothetical protein B0H34DRAFT_14324 [Crassisporium funariophilum]